MKQFILIASGLILTVNALLAQTYKKGTSILNIFTINDTLKYFEFYTPGYFHGNVETGFLVKENEMTYSLQANGSSYAPIELLFKENSVNVKKRSTDGYIAYSLNGKSFLKINDSTDQIVSQFHLNYPIFYKAKNSHSINVYEYPCFESKTKQISLKKGCKIEEKWESGFYKKYYHPIKDKTWIAAVCGNRFIGWLLLSDVENSFEKMVQ